MKLFNCRETLEFKRVPCIYGITNKKDGRVYVGKTRCLYKRHYSYRYHYEKNTSTHINNYLKNSISHNLDSFDISIIETCSISDLATKELHWMNVLNTTNSKYGYNFRMDSSTGMITHKETSEKISKRLKKEWASGIRDGHSKKLSESWSNSPKRRKDQSKLMSKTLTKYSYNLYGTDGTLLDSVSYLGLKERGLQNCLATMCRKQSNKIRFKGFIIEKVKLG